MRITNKSIKFDKQSIKLFEKIILNISDLNEDFVTEIIICDENNLELLIKEIDEGTQITKFEGCNVLAKTIKINEKSIILLTANILEPLVNDASKSKDDKIIFGIDSIKALKTILHEFGHAKNALINGSLKVKKEVRTSAECLYVYWEVLRDEYIAEKYSANICKIENRIGWYGEFNDIEEMNNFYSYLTIHVKNGKLLNENSILQFLLFYYFMPLFKKAGFFDGLNGILDVRKIKVCKIIDKIRDCDVINNVSITQQFKDIVLEIWDNFKINKILDSIIKKSSI